MIHTSLGCMKNLMSQSFWRQIWGTACSSVHVSSSISLLYLSTLLQASLSLLSFFSPVFFSSTSPSSPPSDTESLMCPRCVEELFWVSSPLADSVVFLPLDKTQKPGANPAVQPKRSTKSPSTMTQLRATSLNRINQIWCEIEMRVGGKLRKDRGKKMGKEKTF